MVAAPVTRAAAVRPPLLPNRLGRRRSPWPRVDARTPPLAAVRRGRAHAAADARHEALQGPCARAVLCRCEEGRRGGAVPPREAAVRRPPRPHARPAAWPPPWPGRCVPPWPPSPAAAIATREGHQRGRNEGVQARRAAAARPEPLRTSCGPSAAPLLALPGRPPLRLASRSAAAERRRGPSAARREKAPSRRAGGARRGPKRRGRRSGRRSGRTRHHGGRRARGHRTLAGPGRAPAPLRRYALRTLALVAASHPRSPWPPPSRCLRDESDEWGPPASETMCRTRCQRGRERSRSGI